MATYTNSKLVSYTRLSPNHSGQRTQNIYMIAPHCVVGQASVETLGNIFAPRSRQASCNYGIGADGRVGMYCEEKNRSWCTSSNWVDQRAVTIECASDAKAPYAFNNTVYNKLVDLCVDICKRNGKNKILWLGSRAKIEAYKPKSNEMLFVVHRFYANKSCPGDWLMARMDDLTKRVNAKLGTATAPSVSQSTTTAAQNKSFPSTPFLVQVLVSDLNIRKGAGTNYASVGHTGKGEFTITKVSNGWGYLKSGAGWIYLGNASYVKVGKTVASSTSGYSPSKVADAKGKNSAYNGKYITTADLNLRYAPNGAIITVMPKGTTVYNYGWYTQDGSTTWLCVQATVKGQSYTGYCGKGYLKKI